MYEVKHAHTDNDVDLYQCWLDSLRDSRALILIWKQKARLSAALSISNLPSFLDALQMAAGLGSKIAVTQSGTNFGWMR